MAGEKDLVGYIFENRPHPLAPTFEGWLRESRRFKTFAEQYKDKIRRKLRTLPNERARMEDLRFELEVAYRLHREASFVVAYEPGAALKGRSPDFTVTYKTHTPFNVEATRMQIAATDTSPDQNISPFAYKLILMVCDKVGQMQPGLVNVLITTSEREASEDELKTAMVALRLLAERKAEAFFVAHGFKDAADFLRQFRNLSAIAYMNGASLWLNSLTKHPLSKEMTAGVRRVVAKNA
jgi:hypothetical protein